MKNERFMLDFQFPKLNNYQRFFEGEMISKCHIYPKFMITVNYSFLKIIKDNKIFCLAKICQLEKYRIYDIISLLKKCVRKLHHVQKVEILNSGVLPWQFRISTFCK